jgi:hypothetical protein
MDEVAENSEQCPNVTGKVTEMANRTNNRRALAAVAGLLLLAAVAVAADGEKSPSEAWKFDVIHLKNGRVFRGLILEETPAAVRFQDVRQRAGKQTFLLCTPTFARAEIARIDRLTDADRATLKSRLQEIGPSGRGQQERLEQLELESIPWEGRADAGRRYRSEFYTLESDAPEEIVRGTALRLEQIYAAYARFLPPRGDGREPTAVILFRSGDEYVAWLKSKGHNFVNLAYYNPASNRIVCGWDLVRLGDELARVRGLHQQLRKDLDRQEAALLKLYRGSKDMARHIQPIRDLRQKINLADTRNEAEFNKATQQLFAVLYHEAFHAYLAGWVYPPPGPEVPRWLNEGLAQIFETAIVEAGDLRVGHADENRLGKAKEAARQNLLVPVEQLLRAEAKQFQAAHAGDRKETGQYYLTAWATAFHLTFERRLLGTTALDEYVRAQKADVEPRAAFEALVGCPLEQYEQELRRYVLALQPDGSTGGIAPARP